MYMYMRDNRSSEGAREEERCPSTLVRSLQSADCCTTEGLRLPPGITVAAVPHGYSNGL